MVFQTDDVVNNVQQYMKEDNAVHQHQRLQYSNDEELKHFELSNKMKGINKLLSLTVG
ncbi:unnamed protein product [Schistosoma mattheei]|uniref:Uncharacterized protein n=1 Tax=Schistosoma mattheei TaxID=31246 RepID=A0A3P8GVW3_9TREM|nr:unnamed protein product [Schistosoma mattheei]